MSSLRSSFVAALICALGLTSPALANDANTAPELDITSDQARVTRGSAHSLEPGMVSIRTGVLGTGSDELFGAVGVDVGLGHGVQIGLNLLHATAGLINLRAKWNFLELGPWSFAAEFSPVWVHGNWVWLKSDSEIVGNVDVLSLPFALGTSVSPLPWLQFDVIASYTDVEVFGTLDSESLLFDAQLAMRTLKLSPTVRVHLQKRMSIYASARLPLWGRIPGSVEADIVISPGVVAGVRSAGGRNLHFKDHYVVTLGARSMISKKVFLDFALNYGAITDRLYGNPLYPKLMVEVRF